MSGQKSFPKNLILINHHYNFFLVFGSGYLLYILSHLILIIILLEYH